MGQKGWDMPNYTRTVLKISGNSFISQDDSYPWQTAHPVKVYQGSHGLASPEPGPPHDWSMVGLSYERQQNTREPTSREELWFSSRKPGKLFLRAALRNCRDFLKSVQALLKNKLLHFFPIFLAKYKSGRDGSRLLLSTIFSHVGTIKVFFFFWLYFPTIKHMFLLPGVQVLCSVTAGRREIWFPSASFKLLGTVVQLKPWDRKL